MINDQEYITTEMKKTLEQMLILSKTRLNNLVAMIVGIIVSQSVVLSKISQELKDFYSSRTEESKVKRLQRFLSNKVINPEKLYEFFDHTTIEGTCSNNIHYIKMLYLCIFISYCWMITLGTSCTKDKKNKLIGATKNLKGKQVRIYSLFRAGVKWLKRCYYSLRSNYYFKIAFTLYEA